MNLNDPIFCSRIQKSTWHIANVCSWNKITNQRHNALYCSFYGHKVCKSWWSMLSQHNLKCFNEHLIYLKFTLHAVSASTANQTHDLGVASTSLYKLSYKIWLMVITQENLCSLYLNDLSLCMFGPESLRRRGTAHSDETVGFSVKGWRGQLAAD